MRWPAPRMISSGLVKRGERTGSAPPWIWKTGGNGVGDVGDGSQSRTAWLAQRRKTASASLNCFTTSLIAGPERSPVIEIEMAADLPSIAIGIADKNCRIGLSILNFGGSSSA